MYNIAIVYLGVSSVNCLKCGREIEEGQVFCNDCLVQMAKYPVKPGTPVLLPSRESDAVSRKVHSRRRKAIAEEQVKALNKRIRILSALLAVCVVLLIVLSVVTLRYMNANRLLPGQNYSAVTTTAATEGS